MDDNPDDDDDDDDGNEEDPVWGVGDDKEEEDDGDDQEESKRLLAGQALRNHRITNTFNRVRSLRGTELFGTKVPIFLMPQRPCSRWYMPT